MAEEEKKQPISVTDAVRIATSHLYTLLAGVEDVLLEEVEITDDDRYWLVTLSFYQHVPDEQKVVTAVVPTNLFIRKSRVYKIIKIDRNTGEVRSMKIRELEHA
jgi:hypothetical protein